MGKTKNIIIFLILTMLILTLTGLTTTFIYASLPIQGYYPVSSKGEFCNSRNPEELPENQFYKDWCQKEFMNGNFIYEAYIHIAFGIGYTPEPPNVDLWQTPIETMQTRQGDCEDAILLFRELMPPDFNEGEIIWGFVFDTIKNIRYAHVWFQLYDRNRNIYIVEPFSNDWNGIIPEEIIKEREVRQRIIGIPNTMISNLMDTPSSYESIKNFMIRQIVMYDWRLINQVNNVFAKLRQVLLRYKRQQKEYSRR